MAGSSRLRAMLERAPIRLALWTFGPILLLGVLGKLLEGTLDRAGSPGNPSTLHAVKWMLATFFTPSDWDDSWMPMFTALEASRGPNADRLFETVFFEQQIKFQYPPMSLLVLEPFRFFGVMTPRFLNGFNSLFVLLNSLVVAAIAYRVSAPPGSSGSLPDRRWMAALACAAAWCFYPVVQAHNLGQIQTAIDLLFSVSCLCWLLGRRALAGVAIGAICALKPQLALLLPWALVFRQWSFALGIAATILPIGVLSLARYGLHNHLAYLDVLAHLSRHGESFQFNASMNGLMNRLLGNGCNICPPGVPTPLPPYNPLVHAVSTGATLVFLGLAFGPALLRRRERPTELDLGVATVAFTLASPVAWYHHYGLLLPVYVVTASSLLALPPSGSRRTLLGLLGLSWLLTANYLSFFNLLADTPLNVLQSHLFFGAILLLGIGLRQRLRRTVPADVTRPVGEVARVAPAG